MKIENGILIEVEQKDIAKDGSVIVPEGVWKFAEGAFEGSMKSITFPDSLKKIKSFAFWKCTGIEEIRISPVLAERIKNDAELQSRLPHAEIKVVKDEEKQPKQAPQKTDTGRNM